MKKLLSIKTKYGEYKCLFKLDKEQSDYIITVPSLEGLVTFGKNIKDGKKMVKEAIELHIESIALQSIKNMRIGDIVNVNKELIKV